MGLAEFELVALARLGFSLGFGAKFGIGIKSLIQMKFGFGSADLQI